MVACVITSLNIVEKNVGCVELQQADATVHSALNVG